MPLVTGLEIEVERDVALGLLRRRPGAMGADDAWSRAVDAALAEGRRLWQPAIAYEAFPIAGGEPSRLLIGEGVALESRVVAALFGDAREVVLMVYTIGPALEARIDELTAQREYPAAFALDAVGSAALGKTGEAGYALIEAMAKARGVKASIPLNPGTSHWPLSGQRLIAEMVGAREIGVEARESGVLHPFKSIAFAVALGEEVLTPAEGSSCDYCERRDLCL